MKEKLLFCVLFFVTYKCEGYGPKPKGILGQIISGAQDLGSDVTGVLEEISKGNVFQGQFQANTQQGGYYGQQPNNYGNYKPQKPVDTIIVVVEESPEQNQYGQGQYGQDYGYRPQHDRPNYPHRPGYNDYGGNYNGPWNNGYGHRPPPPPPHHHPPPPHHHHHGPGYGYHHHHPYYNNGNHNENQNPNNMPNNNDFEQNPNGNIPPHRPFDRPFNPDTGKPIPTDMPHRPFDRPINEDLPGIPTSVPNEGNNIPNNNNFDQNPHGNIPDPPHRPFDRPVNPDSAKPIPTDLPHKPFDRPINEDLPGIPTSFPNEAPFNPQKPNIEASSTENNLNNVEKTTKNPKEDLPLFVPLNPNQYVYGGDKIEVNAPKRETNEEPKPVEGEDDYSHSNIDPLDIRIGENP